MSKGPLYGVRLMVLTELEADGKVKADGKIVKIGTPQQVSFDPQIVEGSKQELRGGDRLYATIEELDTFTGVNATFQDAVLNYEAMALIGGGTVTTTGVEPDVVVTGYTPPTLAEQATPRAPFMAEVYIPQYAEGVQSSGNLAGYAKLTLWNCTGAVPTFTAQDQNFLVPSYNLKSRDNTAQSKPSFTLETVTELPAA